MAVIAGPMDAEWLTRIPRPMYPINTFDQMEWLNRDICGPPEPVVPVTPSTGQIWPRGNYDGNP